MTTRSLRYIKKKKMIAGLKRIGVGYSSHCYSLDPVSIIKHGADKSWSNFGILIPNYCYILQ